MYQIRRKIIVEFEVDLIIEALSRDILPLEKWLTAGNMRRSAVFKWIKDSRTNKLLATETPIERWHKVRLRNAVEAFHQRNDAQRKEDRRLNHPWRKFWNMHTASWTGS